MKKTMGFFAGILFSTLCANSQDFSGSWTQKSKEHITGPDYGNAIQKQMAVEQRPDSIIITSVNVGANGQDVSSRQAVANNGKASVISSKASKRKYTTSVQWSADKKKLTVTTVFSMPDNENETDFTRVESWTLSADGKQIDVDKKSVETRSETWEVKAVFAKQ